MTQTLHILAKDLHAHRWPIALVAALTTILVQANTTLPNASLPSFYVVITRHFLTYFLLPVTWVFLIASAIHAEPLPAGRLSQTSAKLLFILLPVHLPLFLSDFAILTHHGFQPWNHLADFPLRQLWFTLILPIPAAALASVTRTRNQFLLAAIAIVAAVSLLAGYRIPLLYLPRPDEPLLLASTLVSAVGVTLGTLHRHRNLHIPRVAILAVLLLTLSIALVPFELVAKAESLLKPVHDLKPTLALDPTRRPQVTELDANALLRIPLAIYDLKPGQAITTASALITFEGLPTESRRGDLHPAVNPQWLDIPVPRSLAQTIRERKPTVHARCFLSLIPDGDNPPRSQRTKSLAPFWARRCRFTGASQEERPPGVAVIADINTKFDLPLTELTQ